MWRINVSIIGEEVANQLQPTLTSFLRLESALDCTLAILITDSGVPGQLKTPDTAATRNFQIGLFSSELRRRTLAEQF